MQNNFFFEISSPPPPPQELIRIIYNDRSDCSTLKDPSTLPGDASAVADSTRGVRSIAIHAKGQHLALGDREGNLR